MTKRYAHVFLLTTVLVSSGSRNDLVNDFSYLVYVRWFLDKACLAIVKDLIQVFHPFYFFIIDNIPVVML